MYLGVRETPPRLVLDDTSGTSIVYNSCNRNITILDMIVLFVSARSLRSLKRYIKVYQDYIHFTMLLLKSLIRAIVKV